MAYNFNNTLSQDYSVLQNNASILSTIGFDDLSTFQKNSSGFDMSGLSQPTTRVSDLTTGLSSKYSNSIASNLDNMK